MNVRFFIQRLRKGVLRYKVGKSVTQTPMWGLKWVNQRVNKSHRPSGPAEIDRRCVSRPGDRGRSPDQHGHQNGGEFLTQSKALLASKRGARATEKQASPPPQKKKL